MDELDFDWWCCNLTAKSPISCFNEQFNTQVETTIWAGTYFHNYLSPPGRYWMNVCVKVGFVEGGSLFFSFVLTRDRMWSENTFSRLTSSINSLPSTVDCISSIIKMHSLDCPFVVWIVKSKSVRAEQSASRGRDRVSAGDFHLFYNHQLRLCWWAECTMCRDPAHRPNWK